MPKKNPPYTEKIVTIEQFSQKHSKKGKKIVLVGGCFDLFHYGHLTFLTGAKAAGDMLVVALESDEFIERRKKRTPVHTQQQRAEILSQLEIVDSVIMLPFLEEFSDYLMLVKKVKPSVIAITEGDPRQAEKQKQADEVNGVLQIVCQQLPTHSTSQILSYASLPRN